MDENNYNQSAEQPNEQPVEQPMMQQQPPPMQQPAFQPQYAPQPQPQQQNKGMAVASMVLGIISFVFCWLIYVGGPLAVLGLVLGIVSRKKNDGGRGMAIAGITLSAVSLGLMIIFLVIGLLALANMPDWLDWLDSLAY